MAPNRLSGNSTPSESADPERLRRLSRSDIDIFGDEFALDSFDVPDGSVSPLEANENPFADEFRPVEAALDSSLTSNGSVKSPPPDLDESSVSSIAQKEQAFLAEGSGATFARTPLRPQSISAASLTSEAERRPHRSISSSSTFLAPRPSSPYRGATGPSHPYGMYPQGIGISRTASTATTSTYRVPDRTSFIGHRGPAHPYAMYPQNTVAEPVIAGQEVPPSIPVGFPGLGQHYQRRLGPDGEEAQDIVGPDGHTEQLPAYSRYPDTLPAKEPPPSHVGGDIAGAPVHLDESRRVPAITESHEAIPQDETSSSSALLQTTTVGTHGDDSNPSEDNSGSFKEKWAEKGRKRVCCGVVPIWAMAVFVAFVIMAAVVGGVIGGSIASSDGKRKAQQKAAISSV
ncbi:MAG: hypothetical protein M1812_004806 [Candelaria pacifica]|nr:MAG: hypothetical protein M1812_004806 [Candelaria pacifica]